MVCKHQSEWSYKWAKIEEDAKKFFKYHYPDAEDDKIQERLDEIKAKHNALYDFWDKLNFKTDTFWYFEPFAWVEQMKRVFGVSQWHDPVDNPICTLYMQRGGGGKFGKHWGLFGKTRNGSKHLGLDLFATTGTPIYACVDAIVYNRRWHGGYRNTLTLKVKDVQSFLCHKQNYKLQYEKSGEMEKGVSWSEEGDIFLFYAHLDSVKEFNFGEEVKCGDVLGTTGRSGVEAGTCAPHLHFEILCQYKMKVGTKYRINPAFFVKYKGFKEQSEEEKEKQLDEKNRGQLKEIYGQEKLKFANIKGFIK